MRFESELVLDDYDNSHYKIFKSSIRDDKLYSHDLINYPEINIINKSMCTKWIKDYMLITVDGYDRFIYSINVFIVKIFITNQLISHA